MEIFHGTNKPFKKPDLSICSTKSDFGEGFYCTKNQQQAESRALAKLHASIEPAAYIHVYEYIEPDPKDFKIKKFIGPTEEWIEFTDNNRNKSNFKHNFDIISGPVADNKLDKLRVQFESGFITKTKYAYEAANNPKLTDQISFHTQKAVDILKYKHSLKIEQKYLNGPKIITKCQMK